LTKIQCRSIGKIAGKRFRRARGPSQDIEQSNALEKPVDPFREVRIPEHSIESGRDVVRTDAFAHSWRIGI
jgi:hypothetical protein